jgi:hypothetical protein
LKGKIEYRRDFWCWWRMPYKPNLASPQQPLIAQDSTWRIEIHQEMELEYSIVVWKLIDPNGFEAGTGRLEGHEKGRMLEGEIASSPNRPESDALQFKLRLTVTDPTLEDYTSLRFQILKSPKGCKRECKPSFWTNENHEIVGWWGHTSWTDTCKHDCGYDVINKDTTNCEWLTDSFRPKNAGRERDFSCWFKAY